MSDIGDELYAWQVHEQPDVWSMVGAMVPSIGHMPLIHRSREVVETMLRPYAEAHAANTGQKLRLAKFILEEVLES